VSLAADLLDLIFPPACVSCAELLETRGPYCALCALGLEPVPRPGCPLCAEPDPAGKLCRRCRLRPPPFASARAAFVHEGPLARAIHRFKYEGRSVAVQPLVLIDDVFTTGATARAASAALVEHGAGVVHVLTLARAVGWE